MSDDFRPPDVFDPMPACVVCLQQMEPRIGQGVGRRLRYLWWACERCRTATAVVPVPDEGVPARIGQDGP